MGNLGVTKLLHTNDEDIEMTNRADAYNRRQGIMFAREFLANMAIGNITLAPAIESLRRSLGNKPPAVAEGIEEVINALENARDGRKP
ncbi:hypothetical protein D3C85_1576340 [compost metagenome]